MENNNTALEGVKMMIADRIVTQEAAEKYFPELKESEDERTQLTEFLKDLIDKGASDRYGRKDFERWKFWLERQGEQKSEEKAKRYDDLLVKLQEAKVNNDVCDERYCCVIDDIVPELKGSEDEKILSEDEKILRVLKKGFQCYKNDEWCEGITNSQILAWLEKQGEKKPDESRGMNLVEEKMTPFQREVFGIIDLGIEEEQGLKQVCDKLLALASDEIEQKSADTWKPSEEQIKELEFFISELPKCSVVAQKIIKKGKDILVSLLSDLKKLREE